MQTRHLAAVADFLLIAALAWFRNFLPVLPWSLWNHSDSEFLTAVLFVLLVGLGIAVPAKVRSAALVLALVCAGLALSAAAWVVKNAWQNGFRFSDREGAYLTYLVIFIFFAAVTALLSWLVWKTK